MVGSGAMEDTLESLNKQTHDQWVAVSLPQIEDPLGLPAELAHNFLASDGSDCDFVIFALAGTTFAPSALQRIASAFVEFPEAQVIYADLDVQSDDGSVWPLALPAFDYERMLEQGYCAYLFAMRRGTAERSLAAGISNLYRLFNSVLEDGAASNANIFHLPGAVATLPQFDTSSAGLALTAAGKAHLQHRGIRAQVKFRPAGILPAAQIIRTATPFPSPSSFRRAIGTLATKLYRINPTRCRAGPGADCGRR